MCNGLGSKKDAGATTHTVYRFILHTHRVAVQSAVAKRELEKRASLKL
jgi:hypothetical protein